MNRVIRIFFIRFLLGVSFCYGQRSVTIATWNLEHFGRTKTDSAISFIAKTISGCDVIAIQEVVGEFGGFIAVKRLTDRLNELSHSQDWNSIVSIQTTGTSDNDERYAYIWRESKVKLIGTGWLDLKYADPIEREPYLATFRYRGKDFTLVNFHAVPKNKQPEHEIKYLKYFPSQYRHLCLIFMGDFNCPEKNNVFNPLKSMGYKPVLVGQKTTLRIKCINGDCLASEYDNIFYPYNRLQFINAGIIPFFQLFPDMKAARKVSDHVPVVFTFEMN